MSSASGDLVFKLIFGDSRSKKMLRICVKIAHSTAKCIISRPKKRGFFANYVKSGLEKSHMKKLISNLVYNLF
ncbi:hypothetical protein FACS189449_10250 [Alphaproteobacteria bacterium]|nr:hypothetical protein FACS189449_10250 [Alphaproteobacteria bacterium]